MNQSKLLVGLVICSVILALGIGMAAYLQQPTEPATVTTPLPAPSTNTPIAAPAPAVQIQPRPAGNNVSVYSNQTYGFGFNYPSNGYALTEPLTSESYYNTTRFRVVTLNGPIVFTVYVDTDAAAVQKCFHRDEYDRTLSGEVSYSSSGPVFRADIYRDAAMGGQRAENGTFRIVHNNACYNIESTIFYRESAQFYDYSTEAELQKAISDEKIKNQQIINDGTIALNGILSTFHFTR